MLPNPEYLHIQRFGPEGSRFLADLINIYTYLIRDKAWSHLRQLDDGNARDVIVEELQEHGFCVTYNADGTVRVHGNPDSRFKPVEGRDLEEALDTLAKVFGHVMPAGLLGDIHHFIGRCVNTRAICGDMMPVGEEGG